MIVFKFGGASVKDADSVRNVREIIKNYNENLVVVISAMGKTTNLLETLTKAYVAGDESKWNIFEEFKNYHFKIISDLPGEIMIKAIKKILDQLKDKLREFPSSDYNFEYDQIICYGELLSTLIVATYLDSEGIDIRWKDIRNFLKTDSNFRDANVDWEKTEELICDEFNFQGTQRYITQGFIGSDPNGFSTSLGREGSDFTAAIIGNVLNAEYVAIWKDVPGVLNADPKQLEATSKLDELSYREAIEMSHSGAKIIHPKTIKPLHNKSIPLYVKSFIDPNSQGTLIHPVNHTLDLLPVYIIKENQVLITLSPNDFSFIGGNDIAEVFKILTQNRFKINLFQQSAIDLSLVVDYPENNLQQTISNLMKMYEVKYNTGLEMVTIRYYNNDAISK
ncbi:MAG: aspartate kinase, partial [Bacteroidales bacterium]|nr:aspartate kinase [Bacteroidales bacterium]